MLNSISNRLTPSRHRGFTLIELMVSIVIVMIMMLVFARVFAMATDTIVRLHAIAENDERARTLTTILKEDLDARTFKTVAPWGAGEDPETNYNTTNRPDLTAEELAKFLTTERQGYIYISDNSSIYDNDDILQFTIEHNDHPDSWFYGKAKRLGTDANIDTNVKQPAWDDQEKPSTEDDAGSSRYAEISYFVRHGVLYRRVLLVRDPAYGPDIQPYDDVNSVEFIPGDYITGSSVFWRDFDYSAVHNGTALRFTGGSDMIHSSPDFPLGRPKHRFGFDYTSGDPREYVQEGTLNQVHVGRFTHEETSAAGFTYPAQSAASPFADATLDDTDANGVVDVFEQGPRRGEDILMTNVLSFDIKIWDDLLNAFVDIGHTDATGEFYYDNADITSDHYGPLDLQTTNGDLSDKDNIHIFDTWHPTIDEYDASSGDGTTDEPPYRRDDGHATTPIPIALKAIQITVRYYDPKTEATRQVTIVQSLSDRFDD